MLTLHSTEFQTAESNIIYITGLYILLVVKGKPMKTLLWTSF